jgi:F420-dependent oxidoreductase-like protein
MDLVGIPREEQWPAMLGVARRLETAGYDSAWVFDHFHTTPRASQEATYECWALTAALAASTSIIRLGQMCTCSSYRSPAYLAKMASTVDVISGGRLDFGIGAGWDEEEYRAYGYEFPTAPVRIAQLGEAVRIIKTMWTEDEASFDGKHHRVAGAINRPKPLQEPHPPVWIAGGGETLTLRVVAEEADCSNFGGTVEEFVRKSMVLDRHCETVGRDPSQITRSVQFLGLIGADHGAVERAAAQMGRRSDQLLGASTTLIGSAAEVVEAIGTYADAGCRYSIVYFPDAAWGESLERFAEEVITEFR